MKVDAGRIGYVGTTNISRFRAEYAEFAEANVSLRSLRGCSPRSLDYRTPRAGAGGRVPPSARIFMFLSAVVN
jgi:hypothetical protein